MKLATPWSKEEWVQQASGEFNIVFKAETQKFEDLFNFVQDHQDVRLNLEIKPANALEISKLNMLYKAHPQLYFRVSKYNPLYTQLRDRNIKFFFDEDSAVDSFRLLEDTYKLGSTDVYILDDLCYRLKDVREFCDAHNMQVRMVLNKVPSRTMSYETDPKGPWFVPEIFDDLSKYIDVVEFKTDSWLKLKAYYHIWFEKGSWRDNLQPLYTNFVLDIPNQTLFPEYIRYKMNCGYKCAYGSVCKKCEQFLNMANDLANKGFEVAIKKEKKNNE